MNIFMDKPMVGQTLYMINIGNAARNRDQILTPVVVVKVGRKYFTTRNIDDNRGWSDQQYHIENWSEKTEYSANSCLYQSPQDWHDQKESYTIGMEIYNFFKYERGTTKISLPKLRIIMDIISETMDKGDKK
jgi:hypothetical protein